MSFMKEQVVYDRWIEIDSTEGTFFIPQSLIGKQADISTSDLGEHCPCSHKSVQSCRIVDGYGARLSAPGYLDCTEWCVFDTEEQAQKYLIDTYGD